MCAGAFFPSFKQCHADSWGWQAASALEQRLCMPKFRVPVVMVHMAGLRNGQWGRRNVMRALGVWHEDADSVAAESWLSAGTEQLLVVDAPRSLQRLKAMKEYDAFAARLLLLGMLLRRRVVMPPLPCEQRWAKDAMEPRHLRALEVGCGPNKQCAWLPMPHFKEPWCSGVDFVYDIDYRELLREELDGKRDVKKLPVGELQLTRGPSANDDLVELRAGGALPSERVLVLEGDPEVADPLAWIPLDGLTAWDRPFSKKVLTSLRAQGGQPLSPAQVTIVKTCLHSLITSKD